ncbi:ExeA family protein [Tropicimonas sp. TH_r6]|uniref:ExeA family protein n=1 Tax=Tropicimonas sp. TH_r6 TaxID=3082085 RepID=UPI00295484F0|nr:AAA family ATPase [Tropicimonas sp. TH_r6]
MHHGRAWSILEYGIVTRAPITLVTGEVGAGKSTLVAHFLSNVPPDLRVGLVANAQSDRGELLHWVLLALDLAPTAEEGYVQLFGRLQEFLIQEYAAGRRVVLIFDEAQNLSRDSLEELRMLTNINSGTDELLQLVLLGQPEMRTTIRHPSLKQFAQRISASAHLPTMDAEMVESYIDHRLKVAGADSKIFTSDAAELVYTATGGIPRLINQLADQAMVYAFTSEIRQVDRALVQKVLDEGMFHGVRTLGETELSSTVLPLQHPTKN